MSVAAPDLQVVLPASDFVDAYELMVDHKAGSYAFTKHIMAATPNWVSMQKQNIIRTS